MPLSSLLKSPAGTCPLCRQKAGILSREYPGCRRTFQAGWNEMVELVADAAKSHEFNPNSLRVSLAEIARRFYGDGATANRVQSDLNGIVSPGTVRMPVRRDAQCCSALTQTN